MSRSMFLLFTSIVLVSSSLHAATRAERNRAAEDLVQEALHREVYGLNQDREKLLSEAMEAVPDFAPARWHQGDVKFGKKWISADDVPEMLKNDPRIKTYRRIRGRYPATIAGQLELADWCRDKGLNDQERAHLMRVLDIDPDHAAVRARPYGPL